MLMIIEMKILKIIIMKMNKETRGCQIPMRSINLKVTNKQTNIQTKNKTKKIGK